MRVEALALLVGLTSLSCGGGEIASSDGGAPRASGALPDGAPPAGGSSSGGAPSGGGSSSGGGFSPVPSARSADGGCAAPQADAAPRPLGAPCYSALEMESSYVGAFEQEVTTESNSPQCGEGDVCLYNHFQGRVTCPYGQDKNGAGPGGTPGCLTAGTCEPVRPNNPDEGFDMGQEVRAQCSDRTAASAVYCSCRCGNSQGGTSDGTYCQCPSGMTCTQLVASLGPSSGTDDISGAYCIKTGTDFDGGCEDACDPTSAPCP